MPVLTNVHRLPPAIVHALSFDDYSKGQADFSVTELLDSPRVRALREKHADELQDDVTDRFWSALGRAVHHLLEKGAEKAGELTVEERLFLTTQLGGEEVTISGAMDLQEDDGEFISIFDHKVTSVWAYQSEKSEWVEQLNVYAYLVRKLKKREIGKLKIAAYLRDWQKSKAIMPDYPKAPIQIVDIPLWSEKDAEAFLFWRIGLHLEARSALLMDNELSPCTDEERWSTKATYAVKKRDGVRAIKVYETEADAIAHAKEKSLVVEKRDGTPKRCLGDWCGVKRFCDYGRSLEPVPEDDPLAL